MNSEFYFLSAIPQVLFIFNFLIYISSFRLTKHIVINQLMDLPPEQYQLKNGRRCPRKLTRIIFKNL